MESTGPEATAVVAALLRAAHLCLDDPPAIFEDTLALALCGIATVDELRPRLAAFQSSVASVSGADKAVGVLRYLRSIMTPREATRRYFAGRGDGLRYPQHSRLMKARR